MEKQKEVRISRYPTCFPVVSQEMPDGVGGWNKASSGGRLGVEDLWDHLEMGAGREESLRQIFCCRDGDETGGFDFEAQKEK